MRKALNQQKSRFPLSLPHPSQVGPATPNQPITRTQKDSQPIKAPAPYILYKQSFVYCCLAIRLPPSNIFSSIHSLKCCFGAGTWQLIIITLGSVKTTAGCIVWSICPDKMSLAAHPEPARAIWTGSACPPASQPHRKHVKVGVKRTNWHCVQLPTSAVMEKKHISECVCCVASLGTGGVCQQQIHTSALTKLKDLNIAQERRSSPSLRTKKHSGQVYISVTVECVELWVHISVQLQSPLCKQADGLRCLMLICLHFPTPTESVTTTDSAAVLQLIYEGKCSTINAKHSWYEWTEEKLWISNVNPEINQLNSCFLAAQIFCSDLHAYLGSFTWCISCINNFLWISQTPLHQRGTVGQELINQISKRYIILMNENTSITSDADRSRPFGLCALLLSLLAHPPTSLYFHPASCHEKYVQPNCRRGAGFARKARHTAESYNKTSGASSACFDVSQRVSRVRKTWQHVCQAGSLVCNKVQLNGLSWAQSRYSGVLRNVAQHTKWTTGNTLPNIDSKSQTAKCFLLSIFIYNLN